MLLAEAGPISYRQGFSMNTPSSEQPKFLVIGSLAASILNFRGQMIEDAARAGYEIHCVVYPEDDRQVVANIRAKGWICHTLQVTRKGMNPFEDLKYLSQLRRLLRDLRPEKIFSYTIKPVIYTGLALWGLQRPRTTGQRALRSCAMITGLGYAFMGQTLRQKLVGLLVRLLYRFSLRFHDLVAFQNPDDMALFRTLRLLGADQRVIRVNGSGVSLETFHKAPFPPPTPIRFLMIARVLRAKGFREYLAAAGVIRAEYGNHVDFSCLGPFDNGGDGIPREEFLNACVTSGVRYLGETQDVRPYLADCHVMVLPSYREGLPRSVLEAMAIGRPIITSDAPGCRETVIEGENGFFVEPRNSKSLEVALRRMVEMQKSNPGALEQMGSRSREIAIERFDVRSVNKTLLEQFQVIRSKV